MGRIKEFTPEKLIIGILLGPGIELQMVTERLEEIFGKIDFSSRKIPFTFTNYYAREMGNELFRYFISFEELKDPSTLASIKLKTNEIELYFSLEGKRRVNLDPGSMALSRFVLASTKESSHRIPLEKGIYGEITLMFERKSFRPLEWTYPDYRSETYIEILNRIRRIYWAQLKNR